MGSPTSTRSRPTSPVSSTSPPAEAAPRAPTTPSTIEIGPVSGPDYVVPMKVTLWAN
ncbi:hypothetical protein [Streptomyces tanashiensis]|uniref:hypothetical protein n=1 Tax=Streptomyces tanashiensis TaxID=67367 RepID=UPI0033E99DD2